MAGAFAPERGRRTRKVPKKIREQLASLARATLALYSFNSHGIAPVGANMPCGVQRRRKPRKEAVRAATSIVLGVFDAASSETFFIRV